jgi:hypothetical protein
MALDATVGGTASDTYGTLVEADAYWTARQAADWAPTEAAKEYALRKAAQYLDNVYRGRWKGLKVNREQALAWPRSYAIDSDGYSVEADTIPQELKNAQFEAANIIAAGTALEATIDRAVQSETVGELSVTYMDSASLEAQYPQVSNWIKDLVQGPASVNGGVGGGSIVRA